VIYPFYDLLLIDVNMPLMDGFQLAQNLERRDLNVRVCFMTSGEINMEAAREVHPLKSIVFHQETNYCRTIDKTH
jgi:CheY-like chemotaxis protein